MARRKKNTKPAHDPLLTERVPAVEAEPKPPTFGGLARLVSDLGGETIRAIGPGAASVAYEAKQRGIEVVEGTADHVVALGTADVPDGSFRKTATVCLPGSHLATRQAIRARFGKSARYLCQVGDLTAWRVAA